VFELKSRFLRTYKSERERERERKGWEAPNTGNRRHAARGANIRRRGTERKRPDRRRNESPKRASIPVEGRMTFGKLREPRKGRFPRVKSTYRLRSRRSSEFPVINYRVDDRVPSLFLPLAPPLLSALLFLVRLPFLPRFSTARPSAPINDGLLLLSLPPLHETLTPFSLFFLYSPNCLAEAVYCVSGQRSNHVWSPFIKLSILDTCTAHTRFSGPSWNDRARVASTISPADFKL